MTDTAYLNPAYAPAPSQEPPRGSRVARYVIIFMALALTALAVAWTMQYNKTADTVEVKDEYKAALVDARAEISSTQRDLTESDDSLRRITTERDTFQDYILECKDMPRVATLLSQIALDLAHAASSDRSIFLKLDDAQGAQDKMGRITDIVKADGYSNMYDMFEICEARAGGAGA